SLFAAGKRREPVPIFPLQTVLFPGMLLPLRIFEVRYMDMAKTCLKEDSPFGVCLIREGQEVGAPVVGSVEALAQEKGIDDAPGLPECANFLAKAITGIGVARFAEPLRFEDPSWVGFRLAEILPLRSDVKQKLLELTDASMRLAVLHRFLKQQKLIA